MREQDVRGKLLRICAQLDQATGRIGPVGRASAVLGPLMIGAGMALLACDGDVDTSGGWGGSQSDYGVGGYTTTSTTATGTSTGTTTSSSGGWGGSTSFYGVGGAAYGVGGWGGYGGDGGDGGAGGDGGSGGWGGAPPPYGV